MYHYFAATEIYNAIRVFIAAYVWMTGFGNFSYYYIRKDFSLARFAQVIDCIIFLSKQLISFFFLSLSLPLSFYISKLGSSKSLLYDADDVAAKFLCGFLLHYFEQ